MKQKGGVVSRKGLYVLHQGEPVITPSPPKVDIKIIVNKVKPITPKLRKAIERELAKHFGSKFACGICREKSCAPNPNCKNCPYYKPKIEKEKVIFT